MGSDFFESLKDLPNSTHSLMFRSVSEAHLPRSLPCRHVGYAVEPIIISSDATRGSHSNSMRRYSHSCTKHRHSDSHCCCPDTAHGLGRLCLDAAKIVYFFQIYAKNKKNRPPKAVFVHTRHRQVDFDFIALRFYATSTVALYLATLDALTILPRKARRDPRLAYEFDAS